MTFPAADGRMLDGILTEARSQPAFAVVLVPMMGRSGDDWQFVAQQLADAGITALAIDDPASGRQDAPAQMLRGHEAVAAAVAYLRSQPENIRPDAIGLAGASLGASLVVTAAASDPAVRSIALVSPALDYRGVRLEAAFGRYGNRPALLVASVHDPYAARSARLLAQDPSGPRELRWSGEAAHGTILLSRDADLVRALVEWFQLTLGVH